MNDKKWSSGTYRIVYKNYPTYSWGLTPQQSIYENDSMMEAIERAIDGMDRYPDAVAIIKKVMNGTAE